ncbi:BREX-1 system adenine-specific DNA-methyltransferase PglX [Vreelandella rituensis]|uniref:site-specific DNA-methyltransferase (adenine-specific) n=1 Tax=Vreelandella rituensis TaxID=2282306 RepID=A0A368TUN2_9GAMM|nr:BREX-1 system adenine-specific DNA-methyltransferase PglX [Halomonas rituensis]RCV88291.1 BREX-1 system adenine-specific DNA-methyltransferase PglX [Halomonas rituensis]
MNTKNIKRYAPQARTRFIETMTRQAARFGIAPGQRGEAEIAPVETRGDVMVITPKDGQTHTFPARLSGAREALAQWVKREGFTQAIEQAAYSWFNRLCAIRYMEIHGYLEHGRRVLSGANGEAGQAQILDECLEIDLPGLDSARVRELKLDGNQDETLYRELLLAQCHALHDAMPFLFEPLDDASELLLPNNLTKTDSLIRELVTEIPEEDWQDVEVIGWLYQFYISEKKDQVIGKVVKSEDIPAATQLFTPNWIVQYLVQNSVGRQWLQTYPDSPLKAEMPYYIEPAKQEPQVQAQLDAITPESIDPETIKVLDPACGSGHILVEAYNVLKAIYEERGFRTRDIPKLILENNLFGLDIDDRAAQLAGFALLMKAREDDRRIFSRGVRLNVLAMQSSQHLDARTLWRDLNLTGDWHQGQSQNLFESAQQDISTNDSTYQTIVDLIDRFQDAKTFGSLIEVPASFEEPLKTLLDELTELSNSGDTMQKTAAQQLAPIVQQAWVLAQRYDAVVANPPYMGSKGMNSYLKEFAKNHYPKSKADLFSIYVERCLRYGTHKAKLGLVTPYVWMFLATYTNLRERIVSEHTLVSLIQLEYNAFEPACIPVCSFQIDKHHVEGYVGSFISLSEFKGHQNQAPRTIEAIKNRSCGWFHTSKPDDFKKIPGSPIAYSIPDSLIQVFENNHTVSKYASPKHGITTGNNEAYIKSWHEVNFDNICFDAKNLDETLVRNEKWYPVVKGGAYRKWYGNHDLVLNYKYQGYDMKTKNAAGDNPGFRHDGKNYFFRKGGSWSYITSGPLSMRLFDEGFTFDHKGSGIFPKNDVCAEEIIAFFNSSVCKYILKILCPTLDYSGGPIGQVPYKNIKSESPSVSLVVRLALSPKSNPEGAAWSPCATLFRRT